MFRRGANSVVTQCQRLLETNKNDWKKRCDFIHQYSNDLSHKYCDTIKLFIEDTLLIPKCVPYVLNLILSYTFDDILLKPKIFPLTEENLNILSSRLCLSFDSNKDDKVIQYIIENINFNKNTQSVITTLLGYTNSQIGELIASHIMKNPIVFNSEMFKLCCANQPYMWPVLDYLLSNEQTLSMNNFMLIDDVKIMSNVRHHLNQQIVEHDFEKFLENTTLPSAWIKTLCKNLIKDPCARHFNNTKYEYTCAYTPEKFELFVDMGLNITISSIKSCIRKKISLPNIERFNIEINLDDILKYCEYCKYYPDYKFMNMSPEMIQLRNLSYSRQVAPVNAFLNKNPKIIPDKVCIENAMYIDSGTVFQTLLQHGGLMDIKLLNQTPMRKLHYATSSFSKQCKTLMNNHINMLELLLPIIQNNPQLFTGLQKDNKSFNELFNNEITDLKVFFNITDIMEQYNELDNESDNESDEEVIDDDSSYEEIQKPVKKVGIKKTIVKEVPVRAKKTVAKK